MNEESDQNDKPAESSSGGDDNAAAARESAEKAAAQAKDAAANATKAFKAMDLNSQIYLGCMGAMILLIILFKAWKISSSGAFGNSSGGYHMTQLNPWGPLILLSGLAGIGLFLWEKVGQRKEPWLPLASAGCAGLAAFCFIFALMQGGDSGAVVNTELMKIKAGFTLFGFYLPFLAAIGATAVSVMRIMNANA